MTKNPKFKFGDKVREKCDLLNILTIGAVNHERNFWKYKVIDLKYKSRWVTESQIIALEEKHVVKR